MILGDARNEQKIKLMPENRSVLDLLNQNSSNRLTFDNNELGYSLTINTFDKIKEIVISGATIEIDVINPEKVNITIPSASTINGGYTPVEINDNYNAENGQLIICKQGNIVITLPLTPSDKNMIKVATLDGIDDDNLVTINTTNDYINSTNNQQMIINTSYSSIEFIFNASLGLWRIITPFSPQAIASSGITEDEARAIAKKQSIIFG